MEEARIRLIQDDITTLDVDAVVNSAKNSLTGGGGVDGAIHRAGGRALLLHCMTLPAASTGDCVLTPGFGLRAPWIIHAVGPKWQGGEADERAKLAQCYRKALDIARDRGFRSIAFPCISTGKFRFPKRLAAETALSVIRAHDFAGEVVLCTHTDEEYAIYSECLGRSCGSSQ